MRFGSFYKHENGNKYMVLFVANKGSTRMDYPSTVIYIGKNLKIWAKTVDNFRTKMTKV